MWPIGPVAMGRPADVERRRRDGGRSDAITQERTWGSRRAETLAKGFAAPDCFAGPRPVMVSTTVEVDGRLGPQAAEI